MKNESAYNQTIKYYGEVDAGGGSNISVVVLLDYDEYDFSMVSCEMSPALGDSNHCRVLETVLIEHFGKSLRVAPQPGQVSALRLHGIHGWRSAGNTICPDIAGFDLGVAGTTVSRGYRIHATVDLTSGKVLSKPIGVEYDWRGNVTQKAVYEDDIHWDLPVGTGTALVRYVREETDVASNKATLLIPRPTIAYNLSVDQDVDLKDLVDVLERDLADVCLLLSLSSRRLVRWYQISFTVMDENGRPALTRPPISRYGVFDRIAEGPRDELINHRDLTDGGLNRLLGNLRASPHRAELNQIILFLVSSQTADSLEIRYFLCHAALDALCSAIYSRELGHDLLPPDDWRNIEKSLRDAIEGFAAKKGAAEFRQQSIARLSDLKRVGIRERIISVCRHLKLDTVEIWPKVTLEEGLGHALRLRNQLFHGAKVEGVQGLYVSLLRLQILLERLHLRVLGWPDDKIWRWYDQALRATPPS